MSIRLTFELDTVNDLACMTDIMDALLRRTHTPGTTPDTWPFPDDEAQVEAPKAAEPAPAPAPVTLEQLRAELHALSQAGKKEQVKALLGQFGAAKLTDLKPDAYDEFFKAAKEL